MNQPTNICPLHKCACLEERCAWWDGDHCAVVTIADSLSDLGTDGLTVSVIS